MLYSHSHHEQALDYFASFLRNILRGQAEYKSLVNPVINDAKSLAKKEKDLFNVSTNGFDVIVYLAQKAPDFFSELDREISEADYRHILGLITPQHEIISA